MNAGDYLKSYLKEDGFKFEENEFGDITFKYQAKTFLMVQADNETIFAISTINKIKELSVFEIHMICNKFNLERNLAKFAATDEKVVLCSYECLITTDFSLYFLPQILDCLSSSTSDFLTEATAMI